MCAVWSFNALFPSLFPQGYPQWIIGLTASMVVFHENKSYRARYDTHVDVWLPYNGSWVGMNKKLNKWYEEPLSQCWVLNIIRERALCMRYYVLSILHEHWSSLFYLYQVLIQPLIQPLIHNTAINPFSYAMLVLLIFWMIHPSTHHR